MTDEPASEALSESSPPKEAPASSDGKARPAASRTEIRLRLFGKTDVGQVREHNEDNFIVADLTKGSRGLIVSATHGPEELEWATESWRKALRMMKKEGELRH